MKYTFNTLEEVKIAIEQWFKDLGYDNSERAEKQYLKIISEVGEMSDALCKEDKDNFLSEAGDVFVTIVGYCLQKKHELDLLILNEKEFKGIRYHIDQMLIEVFQERYREAVYSLWQICISQNTTLLECATIAYNKIQERLENGQLKVINGTIQK